ncbi:hypothetical protein BFW01_g7369 [Lasiodiplodia theobromae]|nr:hypothetical protein BFW01_g7369 [Lasiodiplodia theobromae]
MGIRDTFAKKPEKLVLRFRRELEKLAYWTSEGINKEEREIFHPDDIKKFWTEAYDDGDSRLKILCKTLFEKDYETAMGDIRDRRLRVLSVMVYCDWRDWDKFKSMVQYPLLRTGTVTNEALPLKRTNIPVYLGCDEITSRHFERNQWAFIPIIIGPNNTLDSERYRPPFLASHLEEIGSGAFSTVMKVTIPGKFLAPGVRGSTQEDALFRFAWKKFTSGRPGDFVRELQNLKKLENSRHDNIMDSVADLTYGQEAGILFPLAVCSLHELLLSDSERGRTIREKILGAPNALQDILCEMSKLAEAIYHLHQNIKGESRRHHEGVHGDLHLKNIVIATEPTEKAPAGEWKVIDFGLSIIREEAVPRAGYMSIMPQETIYASGLYPPPEIVMSTGKKAISPKNDVYSFGCILASTLAFLLGGQPGALEFENMKEGPFFDIKGGKAVRKIEVDRWLEDMTSRFGKEHPWISQTVDIINKCTKSKPERRLHSKELSDKLDSTVYALPRNAQPPVWDPKQPRIVSPTRGLPVLIARPPFHISRPELRRQSGSKESGSSNPQTFESFSSTA